VRSLAYTQIYTALLQVCRSLLTCNYLQSCSGMIELADEIQSFLAFIQIYRAPLRMCRSLLTFGCLQSCCGMMEVAAEI